MKIFIENKYLIIKGFNRKEFKNIILNGLAPYIYLLFKEKIKKQFNFLADDLDDTQSKIFTVTFITWDGKQTDQKKKLSYIYI